jgi:hypothetical protein
MKKNGQKKFELKYQIEERRAESQSLNELLLPAQASSLTLNLEQEKGVPRQR